MYGKQISFTYKGEEKLKTIWGGILSMGIMIILINSCLANIYLLINRSDSQTSIKTFYKNNFDDSTK